MRRRRTDVASCALEDRPCRDGADPSIGVCRYDDPVRSVLLLFGLAALLSACADDSGAGVPTPLMTPTPPAQAVTIYVLSPSQVPGYTRTSDATLNAGAVADEKNDASLAGRLTAEGFIHAAAAAFAPPPDTTSPTYSDINSEALIFNDVAGATSYYIEEANRINSVPTKGTLDALGGLPRQHVDAMISYASSQPPSTGQEVDRAFIVLMRTGRVVTEIYAVGASAANTNATAFLPLVTAEQQLLARPPNG